MKKKIMFVFGTRPEAIKMAPIINLLKKKSNKFKIIICITAQHRRMLDQVLKIFKIKPNVDLNIMKKNQNLSTLTSTILIKMDKILRKKRPDLVFVHGDTTTSYATSMASFYLSIRVAHIEAGLRTYNFNNPFPEEFNRQVISKIAKWHFSPTKMNKRNLINEGVRRNSIVVTGNTVIDALHLTLKKINNNKIKKKQTLNKLNKILNFNWQKKKYILITCHRRENFGKNLLQICTAIKELAFKYRKIHFIYSVHPNPNVINTVYRVLKDIQNIHLLKPLEYLHFVYLLKYSYIILTDSGGLQEEAPSLGKPVLIMRNFTERTEAVKAGTAKLIGSKHHSIVKNVSLYLNNYKINKTTINKNNPYGDGFASQRILDFLKNI